MNPKTTIPGLLLVVASAAALLAKLLLGNGLDLTDLTGLMTALAGIGLIAARDGGH